MTSKSDTKRELHEALADLPAGGVLGMEEKVAAGLFPTKREAEAFARKAGCGVDDKPAQKTLWFVKPRAEKG